MNSTEDRSMLALALLALGLTLRPLPLLAQATTPPDPAPASAPAEEKKPEPKWYDALKIRGYAQLRWNTIPTFDDNDLLLNAQGDRYIGGNSGFGLRRARLIVYGDVHERVSVYLQTDFASVIDEQLHVAIVRDWYADIYLDEAKELRLRAGQSKVPFGFENLQSSQNRLPLDRNDALNSAVKDERDLGVFAYWAPSEIRKRFKRLVDDGLKGSGDYGVVGLGVYNGQTANKPDNNDNFHVVGRLAYPLQLGEQFLELGLGGYTGLYRVSLKPLDDGTAYFTTGANNDLRDARAFATFVLYPQPFGLVAEYNVGQGPEQGENYPLRIDNRPLHGGYAQAMYKIDGVLGTVALIPYVRGTLYEGGKKFEANAPSYDVKELEVGAEWQLWKALELTAVYAFSDRTSPKYPYTQQQGQLARLQVQFNY